MHSKIVPDAQILIKQEPINLTLCYELLNKMITALIEEEISDFL